MNKRKMEIVLLLAVLTSFLIAIFINKKVKENCIENGGKVIDNIGIHDSCVYGG